MKKTMLAAVFAAIGSAVSARTFDVKVWRGEPVGAVASDPVGFGDVPDGLDVRCGKLRSGIIAAEKFRLLKAQGLFTKAIGAPAAEFKPVDVSRGLSDYLCLGPETFNLVNR